MNIEYTDQGSPFSVEYAVVGDKITATVNGESDTFDFTEMRDGKALNFKTSLPLDPIVSAERINGELTVIVINTEQGRKNG